MEQEKKNSIWENIFEANGKVQVKHSILLKKVPIFSELKKNELREFERIIHQRRYDKDEVIFYEGEPGLGMYIIESGSIKIYKDYDKKTREELATLSN
ncbi:MAG TPA: cyclic nucleotide-binding domain-containing protein, partial [bacterium]|nr:cyclic nucleotide-binding domain-containing protein [bacterium]